MSSPPESGTKSRLQNRVLVVDDEREVAEVVVHILEENGFQAWAVNNPLEVPARVKDIYPDLLILDFDMPKLLGPELAMLLKSDSETQSIPIIFLSGMTEENHHTIGSFSGAAAYLDKPVDGKKLVETIRTLLGH